jgi:lactoylglutathione lyase
MNSETSRVAFNPRLWVWGTDDRTPRMLHTMIRVANFDRSLRFYIGGLGMKVLMDRFDVEVRRTTGMFLGFGDYAAGGCLELVQHWDVEGPYTHGTGFGHMSIGVPDIVGMVNTLEAMGSECTLQPTVLMAGGPRVAFVKDPDGYALELIETRRPS